MLGSLRGSLLRIDGNTALIEVSGVGYEVEMPTTDLNEMKSANSVFVYIHQVIREDANILYGFTDLNQRSLFRILIKVNGVGPKMALAALSVFSVEDFIQSVLLLRSQALQQIPGVGKKTAERLVVELKDSLSKFHLNQESFKSASYDGIVEQDSVFEDALAAMTALGYKEYEAVRAVKSALASHRGADTQKIIVEALALISKGKK